MPMSPQPFQRCHLGINHRHQPHILPPFPGVLALSLPAPMGPCPGGVWNAPERFFGVPLPQQGFPTWFQTFSQLLGVGTPLEEQETRGLGGAENSRESPGRDLARAWILGRAFAQPSVPPEVPTPLLQDGGHRGDSEPLNPVTGGLFLTATDFKAL